jgi:DNA polymerase III delta subunit
LAAPPPVGELGRLAKLLGKGLPPLLLLYGEGGWFRSQAIALALAAVPKDAELRIIDAVAERLAGGGGGGDGDDDADDERDGAATAEPVVPADAGAADALPELQDLRGGGLFARTAFVVVRRGGAWWANHVEALAAAMPAFGKGCGLVIEAKKLDRRKKAAQALVKAATAAGACFEFRELYDLPFDRDKPPEDGELCKWVQEEARKRGVLLHPPAAWLVVQQVGKSCAEIVAELERLRGVFGDEAKRKPLAPADLHGKLTVSFESSPFEFAAAVLADDRPAAWRSLRAIFDRGVRSKDGKPMDRGGLLPFVTSWTFGQLAKTYEGRQLLDDGVSPRDLAARVGVFQFQDRYVGQVQKHRLPRLAHGLLALQQCQRLSRVTGEEPDVLLERFLRAWFDGAPMPQAEGREP